MKIFDIFPIFAQNMDCVYHNLFLKQKQEKYVYPCIPQFYYIKVGCKGVYIVRACLHNGLSDFDT